MLKLVNLCCFLLLISECFATRFLFGVDVKCDLDDVFSMTISHWEDDDWPLDDDQIADRVVVDARKHIFLYQKGSQDGDSGIEFEPYGWFYHNCTENGRFVKYRVKLPDTTMAHGLEYIEYSLNLTDKQNN